jgi:hypothetical protein
MLPQETETLLVVVSVIPNLRKDVKTTEDKQIQNFLYVEKLLP